MSHRDNFSTAVRQLLALRAGTLCSHPDCRIQTTGPTGHGSEGMINIGVAAHITAASPGGPRYDPDMPPEVRSSAANGIWLCQNHAKLIDDDPVQYTVDLLRKWKTQADGRARLHTGQASETVAVGDWLPIYLPNLSVTSRTKLKYASRAVPFVGRTDEWAMLKAFLDTPHDFQWMVVSGQTGSGKSRLLLELCIKSTENWRAGFVDRNASKFDWWRWKPSGNTLIVVDYASTAPAMVRELLAAASTLGRPEARVRVVLIDREANEQWARKLFGRDKDRFFEYRLPFDIQLEELSGSDVDLLYRSISGGTRSSISHRSEQDGEEPPPQFPLFAAMTTYAALEGRPARGWGADELMRDWLQREREMYWEPAGVTESEIRLLCLASIAGGVPTEAALSGDFADCGIVPENLSAERYRILVGVEVWDDFPPAEPDVLAEFFVLDLFEGLLPKNPVVTNILKAAWVKSSEQTAGFLYRIALDFPYNKVTASTLMYCPTELLAVASPELDRRVSLSTDWSEVVGQINSRLWLNGHPERALALLASALQAQLHHPDLPRLRRRLGSVLFDDPLQFSGAVMLSIANEQGWDYAKASKLALRLSNIRAEHAKNIQRFMQWCRDSSDLDKAQEIRDLSIGYLDSQWRDRQVRGPCSWMLCDFLFTALRAHKYQGVAEAWAALGRCYSNWWNEEQRGEAKLSREDGSDDSEDDILSGPHDADSQASRTSDVGPRMGITFDAFTQSGPPANEIIEIYSKSAVNLLNLSDVNLSNVGLSRGSLINLLQDLLVRHGPTSGLPERMVEVWKDQIAKCAQKSDRSGIEKVLHSAQAYLSRDDVPRELGVLKDVALLLGTTEFYVRSRKFKAAADAFERHLDNVGDLNELPASLFVMVLPLIVDIFGLALEQQEFQVAGRFSERFWACRNGQHSDEPMVRRGWLVILRNTVVTGLRRGDVDGVELALSRSIEEAPLIEEPDLAFEFLYVLLEYSHGQKVIDSTKSAAMSAAAAAVTRHAIECDNIEAWKDSLNVLLNIVEMWHRRVDIEYAHIEDIMNAYIDVVEARFGDRVEVPHLVRQAFPPPKGARPGSAR